MKRSTLKAKGKFEHKLFVIDTSYFDKLVREQWQELICKVFGHSLDATDYLMFLIKKSALNNPKTKPLKCSRCGYLIHQ